MLQDIQNMLYCTSRFLDADAPTREGQVYQRSHRSESDALPH